jgi:hypothetical protein
MPFEAEAVHTIIARSAKRDEAISIGHRAYA